MSQKIEYKLDQKLIQEFIPHRYPFLLVDKVLEISSPNDMMLTDPKSKVGIKVVAQKNVTVNEPFFQGHFPQMPIMPGVLIIEAMAQVSSFSMYPLMITKIRESNESFQCFLVGVDNARFRVPVVPGDILHIESEVTNCRSTMWTFAVKAFVEGKLVAEANLMANLTSSSGKKAY